MGRANNREQVDQQHACQGGEGGGAHLAEAAFANHTAQLQLREPDCNHSSTNRGWVARKRK